MEKYNPLVTKKHERMLREIITKYVNCKMVSFTCNSIKWELVIEVPVLLNNQALKALTSFFSLECIDFKTHKVTLSAEDYMLASEIENAYDSPWLF